MPNKIIVIKGFFTYLDKFNRAKLMFLDDYDDSQERSRFGSNMSFTKSYICKKSKSSDGNNPMTDDMHFYVNCGKHEKGLSDIDGKCKLVPLKSMVQHTVECVVSVNNYRFKKDDEWIVGWNLKLSKIRLVAL